MADPETLARIRAATALDAEAVADAQVAIWRETYFGEMDPADLAALEAAAPQRWLEELADPLGPVTWVALRDEEVVGFARAIAVGAGHVRPMELELLYVRAAERSRRTGGNLLHMAIGDAPCQLWVPAGHDDAVGFFAHHGFALDGEQRTAAQGERLAGLTLRRMLR